MDRLVVIFVEGDTEVDFYRKLVSYYRGKRGGRLKCQVEYMNVRGVGNYQSKVLRLFQKSIIPRYPSSDYLYYVFLCYDTDAFEFSLKPPVDWNSVKKGLKKAGATEVMQVRAVRSIEDWFLYDTEGLRKFLHLPGKFQMNGYSGQKGLRELFRKAKRIYIKGSRCWGLVDALDIAVITGRIQSEIQNLEKELI